MGKRATRGVCIGVDRHLKAGDPLPSDLDPATVQFLNSIGALEDVADEPVPAPEPEPKSAPEKTGKKEK